jgi:hypothetical protein
MFGVLKPTLVSNRLKIVTSAVHITLGFLRWMEEGFSLSRAEDDKLWVWPPRSRPTAYDRPNTSNSTYFRLLACFGWDCRSSHPLIRDCEKITKINVTSVEIKVIAS